MMDGFHGEPPPAQLNMARYCLERSCRETPDKTALIVAGHPEEHKPLEQWTFREVEDAVLRIGAALLKRGLVPGDRIMIRLDNRSEYAFLFFAAIAVGLVALPASNLLSKRETMFLLENSGARAIALAEGLEIDNISENVIVFSQDHILAAIKHQEKASYANTSSDDPAFLIYTSGTTSNPKGVLHAHRSVWGRRPMYEGWYGIGPDDRVLHVGAFNWTYTLGTGLTDPWANGATSIVYTGEKDPSVWVRLIEKYSVTIFAAVPSLYRQILKYSEIDKSGMSSLRHGLTAGETLPERVQDQWRERTGNTLYEALGMSELSTYISSSPTVPPKQGSAGKPQAGRLIEILPLDHGTDPVERGTTGVLAAHISDPGLMLGYWNGFAAQPPNYRGPWFITGDLAYMDAQGYVFHQGRSDDLLNALGYRVSPFEVEQILSQHESVQEVAVAEIPVREDVSIIGAFIVLADGRAGNREDLLQYSEKYLASYKVPKEFVFVDHLPKTANGKIIRNVLARIYKEQR